MESASATRDEYAGMVWTPKGGDGSSRWEARRREDGRTEFWPEGGGFVKSTESERFAEIFEPTTRCPDFSPSVATAEWTDEAIPCHSDGRSWNGWGMPLFEKREALRIAEATEGLSYDPERDVFRMSYGDPEDAEEWSKAEIVSGGRTVEVYGIGAGSWCWEACPRPLPNDFIETVAERGMGAAIGLVRDFPGIASGVDSNGRTALHLAAKAPRSERLISALFEAGADPDARAPGGETPLCMALRTERSDSARLLISAGADPRLATESGLTPLHHLLGAASIPLDERTELAEALVRAGADPNVRDAYGKTPAHMLRIEERDGVIPLPVDPRAFERVVLTLGRLGADLDALCSHGRTPADEAFGACADRDVGRAVVGAFSRAKCTVEAERESAALAAEASPAAPRAGRGRGI